ncbi:MAG: DUF748 domain-containing protein [Bdellovibrionaceae bacterium]|nr:DUF748 domain-containing protein [Pseudobdellovibrionaceae bacterium]
MKKKWTMATIALTIILAVRAITPALILREANKFLASFSDTYIGHLEDFDISIFRGAYQFQGFSLKLKKHSDQQFIYSKVIDVSIAWRELLQGRFNTDIYVDNVKVVLTNQFIDTVSSQKQKSQKESAQVAQKLFPVRIGRLDIRNSSFEFAELLSIPEAQRWRITDIEGRLSNLTAPESNPLSLMSIRGNLFGDSTIKAVAQLNFLTKPISWDVDLELKEFDLTHANQWLKRKVPLTFTSGKLNLYSEVRSENNLVEGYIKPFLHQVDIVARAEVFSSLKQFAIEISTATANLLLRSSQDKVLATKVLFSYENGNFKVNSSKAISEAFKNGFSEKIPEGIDDEISLSKKKLKISKRETI